MPSRTLAAQSDGEHHPLQLVDQRLAIAGLYATVVESGVVRVGHSVDIH